MKPLPLDNLHLNRHEMKILNVSINTLGQLNGVSGQVPQAYKDDKEIELNHVLTREQILMVSYIYILHIVAILVDDIQNVEFLLDIQNLDMSSEIMFLISDFEIGCFNICAYIGKWYRAGPFWTGFPRV
jgi:hypothetical protein